MKLLRKICKGINRLQNKSFNSYYELPKLKAKDFNAKILSKQDGNNYIKQLIKNGTPMLISRLGSGELRCVMNYWYYRKSICREWHSNVKHQMYTYGGIFPQSEKMLKKFSIEYSKHFSNIDGLGIWYNRGEEIVCNEYCPRARLFPLKSIEPYYHKNPWSSALKNKKVLIVHPFTKTIQQQYQRKEKLFQDTDLLPDFTLKTVKAVQTFPGHHFNFKDWFDALGHMKELINRQSFDIALVGAGPYGLPLASYIKNSGKQAIHMGGATQILFGIKGGRWDNHPIISGLYNDFWVRPSDKEKPNNPQKVENSAYW